MSPITGIWNTLKAWYVFVLPLRFNLLVLGVVVFAFRFSDQGQDILRALGESTDYGFLTVFLVASFLLALQLWYWSRHLLRFRPHKRTDGRDAMRDPLPEDFPVTTDWLPRFLGLAVFIIEIIAFVHVGRMAGMFVRVVVLLIILAIVYLIFVIVRRRIVPGMSKEGRYDTTENWKAALWWLGVAVFAEVLFFFWALCRPVSWNAIGAAATLVLTVAVWVPVGTLLIGLGEQWRFPILTAVLVWAFAISRCTDNHEIRTAGPIPANARQNLGVAFQQWKLRVRRLHPNGGPIPAIVVAAEGGGIRAAYWTATVLAQLQDHNPQFSDHVFAISGVSGGSLGAVVYDSILARRMTAPDIPLEKALAGQRVSPDVRAMLQHDALSGTLAAFAQPDLFQRFFPFAVLPDREEALEKGWESAWSEAFPKNDLFGKGLIATMSSRPSLPNLFLNGTVVETGERIITSNVVVQRHSDARFRAAFDAFYELGSDIPLSTAAGMSARFTYVSPAGKIPFRGDNNPEAPSPCGPLQPNRDCGRELFGHVVDGGYFENSGAVTAAEIADFIAREGADDQIVPYVLLIDYWNASDQCLSVHVPACPAPGECGPPLPKSVEHFANELMSPLRGVLNARGARGQQAVADIIQQFDGRFVELRLANDGKAVQLPLGWILSKAAMDVIDSAMAAEANQASISIVDAWIAGSKPPGPPPNCQQKGCNNTTGDPGGYSGESQ